MKRSYSSQTDVADKAEELDSDLRELWDSILDELEDEDKEGLEGEYPSSVSGWVGYASESELVQVEELLAQYKEFSEAESNMPNGEGLIHEHDFRDYAEDFAYDCGLIDRKSQMGQYIDWDDFARDLQSDYSSIELEGQTYYYRD